MPHTAAPGLQGGLEGALRAITGSHGALMRRIRALEARTSNQIAPADTRFESEIDPDTNALTVYLRRVSTNERMWVAGAAGTPSDPTVPPGALSDEQIAALVAQVLALVPTPADGRDGADGLPGPPGTALGFIDGGPP